MNRFIQFEYHAKVLPPIADDTTDEVLSLDKALEPVLSQIDQLDYYIKKARQYCHRPSEPNLTDDESAAVYLYTDDWGNGSLYRVLNQTLQSADDRTQIKPWHSFLKLFKNALEKLPAVKETIWRGLSKDAANQLKENQELVCWGITSCSMSESIIRAALNDNSVLCSIKPLTGKNIKMYSCHPNDDEVLLLPGTRLRVKITGSNAREQKSITHLEEITDTDVAMASADESTDDEKTKDNDHMDVEPPTSTNEVNAETLPNTEQFMNDEIRAEIMFSDGSRYRLTYENGRKKGYGTYYSIDEEQFEGQDADNKANGEGICAFKNDKEICAFKNGDRFIGTFKNGLRHGHAIVFHGREGLIEAGEWANDELTNQGMRFLTHGTHYEWTDESGNKRLYSVYMDDHGNKYIGNTVDNKAEGLGIRVWSDNSRYTGNFKNDKKHGFGIYSFSDKGKYKGEWVNDNIHGKGELTWQSGTKYTGELSNGKKHGQGKLIFHNKKVQEGRWENDEYIQVD